MYLKRYLSDRTSHTMALHSPAMEQCACWGGSSPQARTTWTEPDPSHWPLSGQSIQWPMLLVLLITTSSADITVIKYVFNVSSTYYFCHPKNVDYVYLKLLPFYGRHLYRMAPFVCSSYILWQVLNKLVQLSHNGCFMTFTKKTMMRNSIINVRRYIACQSAERNGLLKHVSRHPSMKIYIYIYIFFFFFLFFFFF